MMTNQSNTDTNQKNALVSVIIPVFNAQSFLAEAIDSVLSQKYRPIEVLIVDDGSTDGSAAIAKNYPNTQYIYQAHQGLAATLNLGVTKASGEFLSFLDADDIWLKNSLSSQMRIFSDNPELDIVYGHHQRFYDDEMIDVDVVDNIPSGKNIPVFLKGTAVIRRESFWRVGLFDTSLKLGDAIDWYSRAKDKGLKIMLQQELVLLRRLHRNNSSYHNRKYHKDYVRIMKATLDRRRQNEQNDTSINTGDSTNEDQL